VNIEEYFKIGWVAVKKTVTDLTGLTCTVVADDMTIARSSGSFISDGIEVGDLITTTGFASAGNNDTFEVTGVTATILTVDDSEEGLVDIEDDSGVSINPLTKQVYNGRCLLGRIRVNTDTITVTPKDDSTELWGTVIDDSEFDIQGTPLLVINSLKATFSGDGNAWFLYKPV